MIATMTPIEDKALAAFLLGVPAAMAGTTDDAVPDHKFVRYAEAFASYTTRFRGLGDDGKISEATATLISPHWAITAAHVVHAKCGSSPLEFCISPGDSGGPLFAGGKLAGVNSFTMASKGPLKSKAGEETAHTRVSLYREWINQVMEGGK